MWSYIVRRLVTCVLILFGISIIIYALIRYMPADYVQVMTAGNPNITDEMILALRRLYGLDTNLFEGYWTWLTKAFRGDLGLSFLYQKPVGDVISSKMWTSFTIAFIAYFLELLIGIPLGIISATKQYSKRDYFITVMAFIGISLPSFFFAAILQRIFAIGLGWLPLQGMVTARMDYEGFMLILDKAIHFVLPICVLTFISVGVLMRYSRTNMLEVLNADYIRTARAKGLSENKVIYKHAFRNTLIPIITMLGGMLPGLFSGAIITENIFGIDGLGSTAFIALKSGDVNFLMGFLLFLSVLTLLGTLISDIMYAVADPRVRLK